MTDAGMAKEQQSVDRMHRTARHRFARVTVLTVVVAAILLALGVWPAGVIAVSLVIVWAGFWDYRKRGRDNGGWIAPPMGSLAAGNAAMPGQSAYLTSNQGDRLVDATGRNWSARRQDPTPEQIATGHGNHEPTLLIMLLGSAAFVAVGLLIYWIAT